MRGKIMTWNEKRNLINEVIAKCPRFELKGKTVPYTSANGHMFSQLNKAGQLGIRFSKEVQEKHIIDLNTTHFKSYGAVLKGYVLMPESMWDEPDNLVSYFNEGFDYVMSLKGK